VSAPSSFLTRLVVVLLAAAAVAACAAPGASRLERAPEAMPPSLEHLTADVLGFTLYDTQAAPRPALDALYDEVGIDTEDARPWIGDHAGVAIRQLPSPREEDVPDDRIWFADVRDREALDEALPALRSDGRAVKAYDDGVLVAGSRAGLDRFLEAADAYAVPERKAMREYAAEAATKAPVAAVLRFDLIRTQARRPFQDDPALLELARWATESNDLVATRDGWIGVTKGADPEHARLVGNVEWVPDLSADVDWGHATAAQLDDVTIAADGVVAVDGIGQHLRVVVDGITRRSNQFATEQDVPAGDHPLDLLPILDDLDGPSTVAWNDHEVEVVVRDAGGAVDEVNAALELAGVPGVARRTQDGFLDVIVTLRDGGSRPVDRAHATGAARAGKPPRPPIAWLWTRSLAGCTGPAAGWITFDGKGEMTLSADVTLLDSSQDRCSERLVDATSP
jgi:hypothetical protein